MLPTLQAYKSRNKFNYYATPAFPVNIAKGTGLSMQILR